MELDAEFFAELVQVSVVEPLERCQTPDGVIIGIEWEDRLVPREPLLPGKARVFFLQITGIGQENLAERHRRFAGVDLPRELMFDEEWNRSAVIDMGVGQEDAVEVLGRDR